MEKSEVPTSEPKKHSKGFWKGVVGAVRKSSNEHGKGRPKSKASDVSDHSPVEERIGSGSFSKTTLPEARPGSKVSDQAIQPTVEERPDSDNFARTYLPSNRILSNELPEGESWEHNPEGKSTEALANEYIDLIGPHPLEGDSDSESETPNATVTEPATKNDRATRMTTWSGIMREASEPSNVESTEVARPQEKFTSKKRSPKQMSEVQKRIRNIEQAHRGLAPVEEDTTVAPDVEDEVFEVAKERLEKLHREGGQKHEENKRLRTVPIVNTQLSRTPGESSAMSESPTLSTLSSRSRGESKPMSTAHASFVPSSRSSGSSAERRPSLPKERTVNVQSSGTRRSDQDIEAESSTRSKNFPQNKTLSPTRKAKDGLGLGGIGSYLKE